MQIIENNKGANTYAWIDGVQIEHDIFTTVRALGQLPFIFKHIALMPDAHIGIGACIGSVIPTKDAIIPSAVGVDIGCGMIAVQTSLKEEK